MTISESLALQCLSGLMVAEARARETGRPFAFDLSPDGFCGSNRDASLPPLFDFRRVHVIDPSQPFEDIMGLCKRVYTGLAMGQRFPEHILRSVAPVARPVPTPAPAPAPIVASTQAVSAPVAEAPAKAAPVKQASFLFD